MSQKKDNMFVKSVTGTAKLIFDSPNEVFHIRKIAKETGLSTTAVVSAVKKLKDLGVVLVEETDLTSNVKANLESESYFNIKQIMNLYRLRECSLIEYLRDALNAKAIVLFGSYAKGEDIEDSDIDLLLLTNTDSRKPISLEHYERKLKRKISLHILKSLDKSSSEFKNSVANGIVLYGYVKVM